MNKQRFKKVKKITQKNSPVLFEDEEMGTSSPDEVRHSVKPVTPRNNSFSGHSTPIRNKIKTDASDSPELNYNESPIEPLTQHPPSEVGWDYQRPQTKENGSSLSSMDISRTPKRSTALLSKKRNSNSPLLHKPLKKKLIQEEQQQNLAGFMEELRAIEMKAKQFREKNGNVQKMEGIEESQLVVELDSEPSGDSDIKLQVSADESPKQNKVIAVNKDSNELLDDSVEEMLLLCSQQVEAQEFGLESGQSVLQPSTNAWRQSQVSQPSTVGNRKLVKNMPKENLKPLNNNTKIYESTGKNSSSKGESNSLEIPDDSFDDFMVEFDDNEFCQNVNTKTNINSIDKNCANPVPTAINSKNFVGHKKFFMHKNSNVACIKQTKIITSKSNCNVPETSDALIQNKVMNTNASFGYLNQNYTKNSNSSGSESQTQTSNNSDKNSETRLFKSKSYSDSHFFNFSNNISQNHSIVRVPQKPQNNHPTGNSESINMNSDSKVWRRAQSSSSLNETNVSNNNSQLSSSKMSNSEGSLSLSTPAEIERKRQQAIMKREAKLRNRLQNASQKRPMQNPIRR